MLGGRGDRPPSCRSVTYPGYLAQRPPTDPDPNMTAPLRLAYQTIEFGETDIHLCTLRDRQQFADPGGVAETLGISPASWPIFGVIWPSGIVLAHYMANYPAAGKKILETGCGMALSSLLLNKRGMDITCTDHHPSVEQFLSRNTRLNEDGPIDFERCDWNDTGDTLGLFDLIIGSDLLYEDQHIDQLADFLARHARPDCEIILVDPGRGRKNKLTRKLAEWGFTDHHICPAETPYLDAPFKGHILRFRRVH